jgi:hypothetical protein
LNLKYQICNLTTKPFVNLTLLILIYYIRYKNKNRLKLIFLINLIIENNWDRTSDFFFKRETLNQPSSIFILNKALKYIFFSLFLKFYIIVIFIILFNIIIILFYLRIVNTVIKYNYFYNFYISFFFFLNYVFISIYKYFNLKMSSIF